MQLVLIETSLLCLKYYLSTW